MDTTVDIVRRGNKLEVVGDQSGELLAQCMIGDDNHVEMIADLLSQKRLPKAAMKLRRMAQDARKERPLGNFGTVNRNLRG